MGRRINGVEAAMQARTLLDQAIALIDEAHLGKIAVHADMARQLLEEWVCLNASVRVVNKGANSFAVMPRD